MTRTQKLTLILLLAVPLYEYLFGQHFKAAGGGRMIRVDLFLIIPILAICVIISLIQVIRQLIRSGKKSHLNEEQDMPGKNVKHNL